MARKSKSPPAPAPVVVPAPPPAVRRSGKRLAPGASPWGAGAGRRLPVGAK